MAPARVKEINRGAGPPTRPRRGSPRPGRRLFCRRKTHCARGTLNCLLWLQGRSIGCNLSGVYERHHLSDNLRAGGTPPRTVREGSKTSWNVCREDEPPEMKLEPIQHLQLDFCVVMTHSRCQSVRRAQVGTGAHVLLPPPPRRRFIKRTVKLTSD